MLCPVLLGFVAAGRLVAEQGALGFSDAQFWKDAPANEARALRRVEQSDFQGLLLDGPKTVRLSRRRSLPLIGVRSTSIRDNLTIGLQHRAVLVLTRLGDGRSHAATAFRVPETPRPAAPPRNESSIPRGRTVKAFSVMVTDRIPDLLWAEETLQATLLLYDQRSNPVVIRMTGDPGRDARSQHDSTGCREAISIPPSAEDTSYRPRPDSPPLPDGRAIALATERHVVRQPGAEITVRGSFVLPVPDRDLLGPWSGSAHEGKAGAAAEAPAVVAVVPVTLVLTGDRDARPILRSLCVPVYGPLERTRDGMIGRGYFTADLFEQVRHQDPQEYALWALSRTVISGPARLGIAQGRDRSPGPGADSMISIKNKVRLEKHPDE